MLALTGPASSWEPKRLRLRLFSTRRALYPRRPLPAAAPGRDLAVGPADRHRNRPPAGPPARLTSPDCPCDQEGETIRASRTPPTRRDSRATRLSGARKRP